MGRRLGQTFTPLVESFLTEKKARTSDVVKAHAHDKTALKAFGVSSAVDLSSMKMQNGGGVPSDDLCASIEVLKATFDTAERAMRPRCYSAHAVLLLDILELLSKEALATRPENTPLLVDQCNTTLAGKACFDALAGYLHECAGLGSKVISEDETPSFRVVPARLESTDATVFDLPEVTSWDSPQEKLNSVSETWKKAHTLLARLFRYRGYLTKPGKVNAMFSSVVS